MTSFENQQKSYQAKSLGAAICKPSFPVPQYGGDCAMQTAEGLSSSTQRLQSLVREINSATWSLRDFFGMSVPEGCGPDCPRPSGHKAEIDELATSARASLENVQVILDHLRS